MKAHSDDKLTGNRTYMFWKTDFYIDNTFSSKPLKCSISSSSFDILYLMSSILVMLEHVQ
jgi:hypothetical protein